VQEFNFAQASLTDRGVSARANMQADWQFGSRSGRRSEKVAVRQELYPGAVDFPNIERLLKAASVRRGPGRLAKVIKIG
jgi:hypothetical protein